MVILRVIQPKKKVKQNTQMSCILSVPLSAVLLVVPLFVRLFFCRLSFGSFFLFLGKKTMC